MPSDLEMLEKVNADLLRRREALAQNPQRIGTGLEERISAAREVALADPGYLVRVAEWESERRADRWRDISSRRKQWLDETSGIPRGVGRELLDSSLDPLVGACCEAWKALFEGKLLILMLGPPGTGKTYGACWALWQRHVERDQAELEGRVPRALKGGRFVTAFAYTQIPPRDQATDNPHATAVALVLDDLGREAADRRGQVEELLIGRFGDGCPTIVTSNLTADEFSTRYDGRVIDRMKEHRSALILVEDRLRTDREEG